MVPTTTSPGAWWRPPDVLGHGMMSHGKIDLVVTGAIDSGKKGPLWPSLPLDFHLRGYHQLPGSNDTPRKRTCFLGKTRAVEFDDLDPPPRVVTTRMTPSIFEGSSHSKPSISPEKLGHGKVQAFGPLEMAPKKRGHSFPLKGGEFIIIAPFVRPLQVDRWR